ncbi:MAG: SMR family transporter [Methylococcus sp.]|nr:SMR family transporter [Methylococcus sp.]
MPWIHLAIAIVGEVIGTSALKSSAGFTQLWPTLAVVVGYAVAFYFLSLTVDKIPVGISYAIWSAVGIVLVSLIAWLLHGQKLDPPALAGMALIIAGVLVCTLLSKSASHG